LIVDAQRTLDSAKVRGGGRERIRYGARGARIGWNDLGWARTHSPFIYSAKRGKDVGDVRSNCRGPASRDDGLG
jgi:hypothetical protein